MARQAAAMPTLFKRSDHGSYCFRRVAGTKRTTINTGTSDYSEAKKFLRSYLQGESATAFAVHQKQHIHKAKKVIAGDLARLGMITETNYMQRVITLLDAFLSVFNIRNIDSKQI